MSGHGGGSGDFSRRKVLSAAGIGAVSSALEAQSGPPSSSLPAVSILDHGARADGSDNAGAIGKAIAAAMRGGRTVMVPPGEFDFSRLDLGRNDAVQPTRLVLTGPGTLRSRERGLVISASGGPFYDLVIDGPRFESRPGAGTALFDGDAFRRLVIAPGTQIEGFDHVLLARQYLQSVRMLGCIIRGGQGAVVKAPQAFDCTFAHNIIEFVTDGIVIDGKGDPAANTIRILNNVIEGIGGRAVVLGTCLASSVSGNYLENNAGGDILLNAGTAPHKGLRVQDNSIQLSPARRTGGEYGIVWGRSTALPVRAGGNFCSGALHDTRGVTAIIDMTGDFSQGVLYTGYRAETVADRAPVGRSIYSDGLAQHFSWFDRFIALDPHAGEIRFGGQHDSKVGNAAEPPVLCYGRVSPQAAPGAFERKRWAQGSMIFNAAAAAGQPIGWICVRAGEPGEWRPASSAL